jgi:uncharacterized protein
VGLFSEGDSMNAEYTLQYKLLPELAEFGSLREVIGTLPLNQMARGSEVFRLVDGIAYELLLTNTGDGVLLTGSARARGVTTCARCLEDADFQVEGEVEGYFILKPSQRDKEMSDDEFTVVDSDGAVDLAVPVLAAIIHELPQVLLCGEDCAGLCPVCGANLNEQTCGCADEPSPDSPFAVLSDLMIQ